MPPAKTTRQASIARCSGRIAALVLLALLAAAAQASGPRWITGPPYFTGPAGNPVTWYTWSPRYFTDPGDLSSSVNHAAADALVAAAAGVWNVPTAGMTIAYGGPLAEHVSGADTYPSTNGPIFPTDVQSASYASKQIAVIYDSDGSITDILLGGGASSPAQCRQNAVTESVDSITPSGFIQHAVLILNGRCTGPAPQQQLQMQYQLERAFGRILGIAWSQTNDNVFTAVPQPTYNQALHWPIMHPIDIVCGPYTYQCLPQPFTLRDDDVAAITSLYPYLTLYNPTAPPPAPGKIWSYQQASTIFGAVTFPTGQGMQGVNIVVQRQQGGWNVPEAWDDTSSVSGYLYQQNAANPVTGAIPGLAGGMGSTDPQREGYFDLTWIPDIDPPNSPNGGMFAVVTTEPINPLYTGAHAVGPYGTGAVEPSGAPISQLLDQYSLVPYMYPWNALPAYFAPPDASSSCSTASDGTETAPLPLKSGGWWNGVLCAHGHAAWSSFTARAGRTATIEVTALDEAGLTTTAKAMPLIGVWAATDPTGTLPTLAATPSSFNTVTLGMTAVHLAPAGTGALRFVIADARGDGRPDFAYQARVLYADSVQPAIMSATGGRIAISGTGFRAGNQVLVNGVAATVTSWTPTAILAVAPPSIAFPVRPAAAVSVEVDDLSTGGSTAITGALTYAAPDVMVLLSAPSSTIYVGTSAPIPFAIRMFLPDGVTPIAGLAVSFSLNSGSAQFATCATTPCVALTDATGMASFSVTPTAFGPVTLQASAGGAIQTATFNAVSRSIATVQPVEYLAAGAVVAWTPQVNVVEDEAPAAGATVTWMGSSGLTIATGSSAAGTSGIAQTAAVAGPLAALAQATGEACAWTAICANFTAVGVDPIDWRLIAVSGAGQAVTGTATFLPVVLMVTDSRGHPVAGAPVALHQTVDAAEMPCPPRGRCPLAPVLGSSDGSAVSDANGLISVAPMQLAGVAEVTNLAVATGTQGFISLSLEQGP
jgi:hypothetical protein